MNASSSPSVASTAPQPAMNSLPVSSAVHCQPPHSSVSQPVYAPSVYSLPHQQLPWTHAQHPGLRPPPSPYMSYHQSPSSVFHGAFPLVSTLGPGVSSVQVAHTAQNPSPADLPPGIDAHNLTQDTPSFVSWTAHKTETGIVYYYNAVTGVSTYEKPPGFKAEPEKVLSQPTPISMENVSGTDWAMVTTNDGKIYYYNNKTKLSSWQIPNEIAEFRKKQESELSKDTGLLVSLPNPSSGMGNAPVSLDAPAISNGGREASSVKVSSSGSTSALDLIKKKLQDAGTSSGSVPVVPSAGTAVLDSGGSKATEDTIKGLSGENGKDKVKNLHGVGNVSETSSDSEDDENASTKDDCIVQFKEMLKERGVAPFSKWEKELPKIVFDPRFKAIPSHSARRSLFEHYVKTRAEEERKEKRAAQKAAVEAFKQLLDEVSGEIDHNTDYYTFRKKWGNDSRFEALDRKDRENLLNERVLLLKKALQEKIQAELAATSASFKSMLRDHKDITMNSRWSRLKDDFRDDPRYRSVRHEYREALFNEYLSELRAKEDEAELEAKARREEQEKLKERERALRKRKEKEEQEIERVRTKVRRKEATASFQALLVEIIRDPQASWTESKVKLDKDPQGRATNPDLDPAETERLFRDHVKTLLERCANDFKALLADCLTPEAAAANKTEDGKTAFDSWSSAKQLLKSDARYTKMPRKDREILWRKFADDMGRKLGSKDEKPTDAKGRSSDDPSRTPRGSKPSSSRK